MSFLQYSERSPLVSQFGRGYDNGRPYRKNTFAILLFYYGQLGLREIADFLDISVVAVKSRLKQARKELRAQLFLIYPELQPVRETRKKKNMQTLTIADVIQQDPYSIAILVAPQGRRVLPLWIGHWEGQAILSTLQNLPTQGPLSFSFTAHRSQPTPIVASWYNFLA